jgi:hypothetical protein
VWANRLSVDGSFDFFPKVMDDDNDFGEIVFETPRNLSP